MNKQIWSSMTLAKEGVARNLNKKVFNHTHFLSNSIYDI